MKRNVSLLLLPVMILFQQCQTDPDYTEIKLSISSASKLKAGDPLKWTLQNPKQHDLQILSLQMGAEEIDTDRNASLVPPYPLGEQLIRAKILVGKDTLIRERKVRVFSPEPPKLYTYTLLNEYRHDPDSYTQGLEFYGDTLIETTGKKGQSVLRKIEFETGKVWAQTALEPQYFGEGVTIWNNEAIWLTWQAGIGFVFDLKGLAQERSFAYGKSKQGWGLCHDDQFLYKSDGTHRLWKLDPFTLKELESIQMVTHKSLSNKANELEYVDGIIYANVYQKQSVLLIDAQTGAVKGVVNMGGLMDRIKKGDDWDPLNSVLNGIAYHPERKSFFVTGKNWNKLFEIRFEEK